MHSIDEMPTDVMPDDAYRFLGHQIRVRSNSTETLAYLRLVYGRFYEREAGTSAATDGPLVEIVDDRDGSGELRIDDPFHSYRLIQSDAYAQFTSQDRETGEIDIVGFCDASTMLQTTLLRTVALAAADHHLLHAGAAARGGAGVIFPAEPGLGKTTLVLALARHGWEFLSDEVACLSADGRTVFPFPRSVIVKPESRELLGLTNDGALTAGPLPAARGEQVADVEAIVPNCLSGPVPLQFVIFLRGFGEQPRLERLAKSNALFELFPFAVGRIGDPGRLLYDFAPVLDRVRCYNLVTGGLDDTVDLLSRLLDGGEDGAD